ncbi:MAG: HAD family hydrolase [Clostridia bacterium]|nr:HAD family hydrolase [Clostridia bacterium]
MRKPKLVALDLDGTLLDSDKRLSKENDLVLARAAGEGVTVVPATGRFYEAMPEEIRRLPYVRYVIEVNGAGVVDLETGEKLVRADIPWDEAVAIMEVLDGCDVIYDCFSGGQAFMGRAHYDRIPEFAPDRHYYKMLTELRQPVDDLKAFLRETKRPIQKTQFFFRDMDLRARLLKEFPARFSGYTVTSSVVNNIEITHKNANKGHALTALGTALGIDVADSMAFGDDLNDVPMLLAAGVGVAMANAGPEAKAAADLIAPSNDENGVAIVLARVLWGTQRGGKDAL